MIDFSLEITELQGFKEDFDWLAQSLFELRPDIDEDEFPEQKRFAVAGQIIHTRYRVAALVTHIQNRIEEETEMEEEQVDELLEPVYHAFMNDDDLVWPMIDEIAVCMNNTFALSFISRYQDIVLSVLGYCKTWDTKCLQKKFREIPIRDFSDEPK